MITSYPGEAIVPTKAILDGVSTGVVEIAKSSPGYWSGTIPEAGILAVPMNASSWLDWVTIIHDYGMLPIVRDAYAEHIVYLLTTAIAGNVHLWSTEPVRSMDDLKGMKIRGFGLVNQLLDMLGASAVALPHAESYMALQLGTVEGYVSGINRFLELKHWEMCKYFLRNPIAISGKELLVNRDAWNELPDDLQSILFVAGKEFEYNFGRYTRDMDNSLYFEKAQEYGVEITYLTAEDATNMRQVASQIWDDIAAKSPGAAEMVRIMKEYQGL